MHHTRQRRLYIAQALLLGLPGAVAGGGVAALGIYTFFDKHRYMGSGEGLFLLCWAFAGIAGVLGWAWLSGVYLRRGRAALRRTGMLPWMGLGLGALAAFGVIILVATASMSGSSLRALGYLLLGPPLLTCSVHLVWLRAWPGPADEP